MRISHAARGATNSAAGAAAPENRLRFIVPACAMHSIQMQIRALRFHKEYRFNQSSA
jgi:hypothetical protein